MVFGNDARLSRGVVYRRRRRLSGYVLLEPCGTHTAPQKTPNGDQKRNGQQKMCLDGGSFYEVMEARSPEIRESKNAIRRWRLGRLPREETPASAQPGDAVVFQATQLSARRRRPCQPKGATQFSARRRRQCQPKEAAQLSAMRRICLPEGDACFSQHGRRSCRPGDTSLPYRIPWRSRLGGRPPRRLAPANKCPAPARDAPGP